MCCDDRRYSNMTSYYRLGILLLSCSLLVGAVDRGNFKTCEQSSFCRRCRRVEPGKTPYEIIPNTAANNDSTLYVELFNKDTGVTYTVQLTALLDHNFRLRINEKNPLHPRYEVEYVLKDNLQLGTLNIIENTKTNIVIASGPNKVIINTIPFKIDFYSNDVLVVSANARGLMRFEHLRTKPNPKPENEEVIEITEEQDVKYPGDGADEDSGAWEESFKNHHDSKPNGPEAVAMDFSFPGAEYAYGIPEHCDSLPLRSTKQIDPYRLYNLDVFEYEINERMALYGAIPVLYAHGKERTSGVFWLNAAETWIDILSSADNNVVESIVNFVSRSVKKPQVDAHFMSESGIVDVFFLMGPRPMDVFKQYTALTGVANLPPIFALGYHQSRWNYNDQADVEQVNNNFDKYDLPMDVIWLDIEYTDSKKYFTWDQRKFPEPLKMIQNLTDKGRKLVVIIDPHIKRDTGYFLHNDATSNGMYVKHQDGKDYEGWCWPGSTSYLDFFNPKVREYVMDLYGFDKFHGTNEHVHIWNDMNEPSVFNGPEITMPKDLMHYGGWEHRDVHNIYGLLQTVTTYNALIKRNQDMLRPFILTRSHFAGSQRYAAVWTGDNMGRWDHLQISYPMCLSLAISGISFCGADVAGFFKNPDAELFIRWNQAGVWLPFFRQHSHIETKRREPWTFNDEVVQITREALRMRYSYLPMWYTLFREHEITGSPVIRPIWTHYPTESQTFAIDDELLVGDTILVRPVYQPSESEVTVYLPGEGKVVWYDIDTLQGYSQGGSVTVPVTLHKIPVFQRGGTIIPRKMRIRRSTQAMKNDPYTLIAIADGNGRANGTLYIDDEETFNYRKYKEYLYLQLQLNGNFLTSKFIEPEAFYPTKSWLERVDIVNPPMNIKSAILTSKNLGQVPLETKYNPNNDVLTIRKPGVNMSEEWTLELVV